MKTTTLAAKPLSVNQAWAGKRFKTPAYKAFEQEIFALLPRKMEIPEGKLAIHYIFGFSNPRQDFDGPVKLITDILQKAYSFDDNRVYYATIEKRIVSKGSEYIEFCIQAVDNSE